MEEKNKAIYNEARARIMWGEPVAEIEEWLEANGQMRCEFTQFIKACCSERAKDIRIHGIRNCIIWSLVLIVAIGIHICFWYGLGFTTWKVAMLVFMAVIFSLRLLGSHLRC